MVARGDPSVEVGDAVMLSSESASSLYPVEAVEAMARVCLESEKEYQGNLELRRMQGGMPDTIGEPVGMAGGTNTMKIVKVGEHINT